MLVTGDFIGADEALAKGLVNRVADAEPARRRGRGAGRAASSPSRASAIALGKAAVLPPARGRHRGRLRRCRADDGLQHDGARRARRRAGLHRQARRPTGPARSARTDQSTSALAARKGREPGLRRPGTGSQALRLRVLAAAAGLARVGRRHRAAQAFAHADQHAADHAPHNCPSAPAMARRLLARPLRSASWACAISCSDGLRGTGPGGRAFELSWPSAPAPRAPASARPRPARPCPRC